MQQLSENEAKIYDRQIRLWGVLGQQRLRSSKVLIYGLRGLSAELCKNLVLAGVGSLCVMDENKIEIKDLGSQFFLRKEDVGENRAEVSQKRIQELNPLVKVSFSKDSLKEKDEEFFKNFDVVVVTNISKKEHLRIDKLCKKVGTKFFISDTFGLLGYMFSNLHEFQYVVKNQKEKIHFGSYEEVMNKKNWSNFSKAFLGVHLIYNFFDQFGYLPNKGDDLYNVSTLFLEEKGINIKDFFNIEYCEKLCSNSSVNLSPICSLVAGIVSQEIIKSICMDSKPIDCIFVFDGIETFSGVVEKK